MRASQLRDSAGLEPDFALSRLWDLHSVRLGPDISRLAPFGRPTNLPTLAPMTRKPILWVAALAVALLALRKRPSQTPERPGAWEPVEIKR